MSTTHATGSSNRWHVLVACFLAYAFDAMDFMLLAVAMPAIIADLHLSLGMAGLIGTATLIGVGFSSVLIGWYSDNYGRKRALVGSLLAFGVFTAAVGFAQDWSHLMLLRFLAGLGLGGVWGVAAAFIRESFPSHQRGRAAAFVLGSWPIGFGFAAFLARLVLPVYGWRALFFCGIGAILAAIYTLLFVRESEAWGAERHATGTAAQSVSVRDLFLDEFRATTLLGTLAATFALVGYWGANTWIPTYLVKERGLDTGTMTTFVILLNVGMFLGYQLFGWLGDKIGRERALILSFAGAVVTLPIYAVTRSTALLLWMGPVTALFFSFTGIFGAYFAELYPARIRSLGAGFCFNVGRGLSAFAPFALGAVAAKSSLATGIALCGFGFGLAGVFTALLARVRRHAKPLFESAADAKLSRE
ncbi:MFS transporter (plasmid) [Paraburkholderia phytofirmans OLGA172]|uniref:MFS transporter n=1 Tax=Paraburkholderia phytofirmans OLGA172 TaxID=1417228 RepID=A0A160FWZ9_9BURK|nr:MFS transporter [Paraburkholderia phytofirmans]ANB77814.1 MFS transporter [Paraburkholderia phytofirmans OLGA172]